MKLNFYLNYIRITFFLAYLDIKHKYHRSLLGPFWFTLNSLIVAVSLGFLYSNLFNLAAIEFIPHLTIGFVTWNFINLTLFENSRSFLEFDYIIRNSYVNPLQIIFRVVLRNFIIFFHNFIAIVLVLFFFDLLFFINIPFFIIGAFLVFLILTTISIPISFLSTRFHDVSHLIQNILQVFFFFTPIVWKVDLISEYKIVYLANPFYYLVEVVRKPILGINSTFECIVLMSILPILIFFSFKIFNAYKKRYMLWL